MEKCKPYVGQVVVQMTYAGLNILTTLALKDGMNNFVFVTYRLAIATLAIAPLAYVLERNQRPPLTWSIFFQIFLLACGISIFLNAYSQGIYYTSSTFGGAAQNLVPIMTFVMATFLRLEKFDIKSLRGQAKIAGTIVCVSGAMIMTFYKGPAIKFPSSAHDKFNLHRISSSKAANSNMVLGSILVYGGLASWSAWITFQGPVLKRYPSQLSVTALTCLLSTVQSAVVGAICGHKNLKMWAIKSNIQLLSVLYTGIICSAFGFFVQAWCIKKKGPVFAGVFSPLNTISTALLEFIVLHVSLHTGSVVGAFIIIIGLYSVLWGKANDHKRIDDIQRKRKDGDKDGKEYEDNASHIKNEEVNEGVI